MDFALEGSVVPYGRSGVVLPMVLGTGRVQGCCLSNDEWGKSLVLANMMNSGGSFEAGLCVELSRASRYSADRSQYGAYIEQLMAALLSGMESVRGAGL